MIKHITQAPLHKPFTTIILCLLLVVVSALGANSLYFRGDYKVFFKEDNPQRMAYELMQSQFSKNENVGVIVAPTNGNIFTEESLSAILQLTDDLAATPHSSSISSITNFQHTYAQDDDLIVEELLYLGDDISPAAIERVRQVSLQEPELLNKLIAEDGSVTMVNILLQLPDENQTEQVAQISQFVRTVLAEFKNNYPNIEFKLTGTVMMTDAFQRAAKADGQTLFPLMFIVISIVLYLMMRSVVATLATLIIVFTSIAATMGMAGWWGLFLSAATVNVPIIVMTLAVADSIHLVASAQYYLQDENLQDENLQDENLRGGELKQLALQKAININAKPIIITSVTTAIGFLSLNFGDVPILADLGNMTAFGVLMACILSLTLLPALLSLLPLKANKSDNKKRNRMASHFSHFVVTHSRSLAIISVIVFIGGAYLSSKNELNDFPVEYFAKSTEFRQDVDFQEQHLTGFSGVDFSISTSVASGINEPKTLKSIDAFAEWLSEQEEVDHVSTVSSTYKRLNKNMNNDNADFYVLPTSKDEAAQFWLLYEFSLPFGFDLNTHVDMDKSATRVTATVANMGSKELIAFENKAVAWFQQNSPYLTIEAASTPLMFAHISEINMQAMLQGAVVALLLISALLIFALKSLKIGLLSLLPNVFPAAIGFGAWFLLSGQINMGLSVVLSLTIGIIVDDTVHFLSKFQYAREKDLNIHDAITETFKNTGFALITTTLVLALGFSVLSFSDFTLNSDMGILTAIIIVTALLVDFLFLPAFLVLSATKEERAATQKSQINPSINT